MTTIDIHPAPGKKVPDPVLGDFLPEEGRTVTQTTYWIRRLRDGDVLPGLAAPVKKTGGTTK